MTKPVDNVDYEMYASWSQIKSTFNCINT